MSSETRLLYLPTSELIDDPLNAELRPEDDQMIQALADDMKSRGFLEACAIVVYPYESTYRIVSGHRRKKAALMSNIEAVPCIIIDPPATDYERRVLIGRYNLHSDNSRPIFMARMAEFLFQTYKMKRNEMKKSGEDYKSYSIPEKVAEDMEISPANVFRYRCILKLSDHLQELIIGGEFAWVPIAEAHVLTADQQELLYTRIKMQAESGKVTGEWIREQTDACRKMQVVFLPEIEGRKVSNGNRHRRKNGGLAIQRCMAAMEEALDHDASYIKGPDGEAVLQYLKRIHEMTGKALEEFKDAIPSEFNERLI